MTIIGTSKLYRNNLENVAKLFEKHQQNPKNNGINIIDQVISLSSDDKLCTGNLLSVRNYGQDRTYSVIIKNLGNVILGQDTELFTDSGKVKIKNGSLRTTVKVKCFLDNKIEYFPILQITEYAKMYDHYQLRISNRDNYILSSGLIVCAD